ncbi:MAG: pilus assembly FimT family protein [Vicinamibacterales bacterium]
MILGGQGTMPVRERGYAMAALLVGLSVMAVMMGVMLPVWSHMIQREKEAELIFRGQQYARAIGLFQRKFANTAPPTIDLLVEQRFLRKKYKDPITNDDFQPLYANQSPQGVGSPLGSQRPGQTGTSLQAVNPAPTGAQASPGPGGTPGGIIGVTSKSKESSIKIYNGRSTYNEWAFVFVQTAQRPTGPATPGDRGGRPGIPGQEGPGGPTRPIGAPGFPSSPGVGQGGQAPRPPVGFPGMPPPGPPQPGSPRRPGQ